MRHLALAIAAVGLLAAPTAVGAAASQLPLITSVVTFTGKMLGGRDNIGLFGPWGATLTNKNFSLVYTVKTFASASVSAGVSSIGLSSAVSGMAPTTLDFSLTINNHSFRGSADAAGTISATDGFRGTGTGKDSVAAVAQDVTMAGSVARTFDVSAAVSSTVHDLLSNALSSPMLPSMTYTLASGDQAAGQFVYSQSAGALRTLSSGQFSISSVSIASSTQLVTSPVPEPGEWAMLGLGLGLAGWTARRRRVR